MVILGIQYSGTVKWTKVRMTYLTVQETNATTNNTNILSRAICRGAPLIRWREDCKMEMANNF